MLSSFQRLEEVPERNMASSKPVTQTELFVVPRFFVGVCAASTSSKHPNSTACGQRRFYWDRKERGGAQRLTSNMGVLSGMKLPPGKTVPLMCFESRFSVMMGNGCACDLNVGLRANQPS